MIDIILSLLTGAFIGYIAPIIYYNIMYGEPNNRAKLYILDLVKLALVLEDQKEKVSFLTLLSDCLVSKALWKKMVKKGAYDASSKIALTESGRNILVKIAEYKL